MTIVDDGRTSRAAGRQPTRATRRTGPDAPGAAETAGRPLRVLIAEDRPTDAELMLHELRRAGLEVHARVVDRAAAFRSGLEEDPPDVVLSDHAMPDFSAHEVLELVTESGRTDIPVIVVSGTLGDEDAVAHLRNGAVDFLLKDRLGRLPQAIERALLVKGLERERNEAHEEAIREVAERRRSEAYLQTVLDTARDIIVVLGIDGRIQLGNRQLEVLAGRPLAATIGLHFSELLPVEEHGRLRSIVGSVLAGADAQFETWLIRPDATRVHLSVSASPLVDGDAVTGIVGTASDITERDQLEQQLRQAQKMEAVGQLAGGVAHDFNNLITAILGHAELVRGELPADGQIVEDVAQITAAANRARTLTSQLLAFSRRQIMRPATIDLNDVVRGLEPMLRRVIEANVDLRLDLKSRQPIEADAAQIEQVIVNLVVNARDAMADGGTVAIETRDIGISGDAPPTLRHMPISDGSYVALTIRDAGAGMPEAVLSHAFEPFFTTKPVGQGTGLGLATVYGIVKQSGGFVTIDSTPGVGTSVLILLPAVGNRVERPLRPVADSMPTTIAGSPMVLVVEDEPAVRTLVHRTLEALGCTVVTAPDGPSGVLESSRLEHLDLLVSDVVMPGANGPSMAGDILRKHPTAAVLYMSGYPASVVTGRGLITASDRIIEKPFTGAELRRAVKAALATRPVPASPATAPESRPGSRSSRGG